MSIEYYIDQIGNHWIDLAYYEHHLLNRRCSEEDYKNIKALCNKFSALCSTLEADNNIDSKVRSSISILIKKIVERYVDLVNNQ